MDSQNSKDDIRLLNESLARAEAWYTQAIEASTNIRMRQTASNLRNRVRALKQSIRNVLRAWGGESSGNSRRTVSTGSPKQALSNAVSRLVQGHPESATRMRELTTDFARLMCDALSQLRERAPSPQAVAVLTDSRKKMRALIQSDASPSRD